MITIGVVNSYFVRICTISILEDIDIVPGDELSITIENKNIPFKVVSIGNINTLKKINIINKNSYEDSIHAKVINIADFKEFNKLVG